MLRMDNKYLTKNIFLLLLVTVSINRALGIPGMTHDGIAETGSWIAGNSSSDLITHGNSFSCNDFCYALWEDCVSSGEHFWRVYFETEISLQAVELPNEETFVKEFSFGDNLLQTIEAGSTVEILSVFSDGKLKGYFGYNNQSLRQILELEATALSKVCPAIRFYGSGRVKIEKVKEIPPQNARKDFHNFAEVEGEWLIFRENIKTGEADASKNTTNVLGKKRNSVGTLTVEKVSDATNGRHKINLRVINSMVMEIRIYDDSWKTAVSSAITEMAGPPELMNLEYQLSSLLQNPDSVKIVSGNLVVQKDNMEVKFVR